MRRRIGAHVSIAGGVQNAPVRARELDASALGMFTKNQRQWAAPPLDPADVSAFGANLRESGIAPAHVLVHSSYLINVGNPDREKRRRAVAALLDEARRVEALGLTLVNFHPGSGLGDVTEEETVDLIAEAVSEVLEATTTAVLVLEATAGQGNHVGYRFEQLAAIVRAAGESPRIGVCVDTCHIFAGGYDIRSDKAYDETVQSLADAVGLDRLAGVHLNDSRTEFASRHDRHESIGVGTIGLPGLARFLTDPRIPDVPFVLETPRPELWDAEIALLCGIAEGRINPETATPPASDEQQEGDDPG